MIIFKQRLLLYCLIYWVVTTPVFANQIPENPPQNVDSKNKILAACASCHGKTGNGREPQNQKIPKIAGFSAILIYDILDQFSTDDRHAIEVKNQQGKLTDMNQIAKKLTDGEREQVALHYSQQHFEPDQKAMSNPAQYQSGKQLHEDLCNDCHTEMGTSSSDDAPILAGQWKTYLTRQFEQISRGKRFIPKRMKRKFRKLSEQDKLDLIEFYTSENL